MMDIEFVDELPSSGRGTADSVRRDALKNFADQVEQQPGRWAKYPFPAPSREAARSRASRINHGKVWAFGRKFRAVARGDVTYIRYEGNSPERRVSLLACPHNVPNFGPECPQCDR